MHVGGIRNEAHAECFATQLTQAAAEGLGATGGDGSALGKLVFDSYEECGEENPAYYTPYCTDGSTFDLYPETSLWP